MKHVTPYEILDGLLRTGEAISLREMAKKLAEPGENLDRVIVELEELLTGYERTCKEIGEEPVVVINTLTDEIETVCFESARETLIDLAQRIQQANRAWLSYYLRKMPWQNFELMCKELLEAMSISDVKLTDSGPDGGIDFTGSYFNPALREMVVPVIGQAKRWGAVRPVGVGEVRSLTARLAAHKSPAAQGFLMTTSYFSPDSITEAGESPKKIYLWKMGDLISHLMEFRVGLGSLDFPIEAIQRPHWDRLLEKS